MTYHAAIQSAEAMAFLRTAVAGEENLAVAPEVPLAKHFLPRKYRLLISVSFQALSFAPMLFLIGAMIWLR